MIVRFDRTNPVHLEAMRGLPFSYMSCEFSLAHNAYLIKRHGEWIPVAQDLIVQHEFPAMFLPHNPENWEWMSITFATKEDIEKVRASGVRFIIENSIGTEFFYKTNSFVNPTGSFKKKVENFKRKYAYKVLNTYDKEAIKAFFENWKANKKSQTLTFDESESAFFFGLEHLDTFGIKQVYVEIDEKLAGLAWGVEHWNGNWAGLHLKVDYQYRDLSRFLHHERAKLFADHPMFTLGTEALDKGIAQYKRELKPAEERKYTYILTGEFQSNNN